MYVKETTSTHETGQVAEKLAERLKAGDVLTLTGDLGAGKTIFTKGLAKGLKVEQMVNSPTYTIIKEYEGRLPLYHMDVYRLDDEEDLGFDEYFSGTGITVVEWPDRIESWLPDNRLDITIEYKSENERIITLSPKGQRYDDLCKEIFNHESAGN